MVLRRILRNERGDTLIEVTLALSILAVVLTSGFVTANRAYIIGQNARERTEIINLAQAQAELLKNYRDIHNWNEFTTGTVPSTSGCPTGISPCFHMTSTPTVLSPVGGSLAAISTNGSISIVRGTTNATYAEFEIVYVLNPRGGGVTSTNRIPMKLANLDGIFQ